MAIKFIKCTQFRDLRELVGFAAEKHGSKPGYKEIGPEHEVIEHSYIQLKEDTEALAAELLAQGMKGRHIALIGGNSYNYVVCYLAVVNYVGVVVPIDKEMTCDDIIKLLAKSDAEGIFFSDSVSSNIPYIMEQCTNITFTANITATARCHLFPCLKELVDSGKKLISQGKTEFLHSELDAEKMCTILFTSGTTGANKGVMLSHKNITTTVFGAMSMFVVPETSFSVLPINHAYEFNIHVLGALYGGGALCFNNSIKHVKENLKIFQPYMSIMVPMIVESLYANIWKETEKAGLTGHLKFGIIFSKVCRKIGIDNRRILFFPIYNSLGGNLRLIVCGGAPLNPQLVKGFDDIGISVYNGYGITECSPLISSNSPIYNRPGSVGIPAPGCEVRIGDLNAEGIGEIQVRGNNVMLGYYKDEESTRKSFTEDGWFKTGDLGYMKKGGTLFITGRAKNLIILSNGKNIFPEELEEHLVNSISYVREVVVFAERDANGNDCVITAAAYLDEDFTNEVGMNRARQIFTEDVEKVNRHLAAYKRIDKATIREKEFDKTTTKKIKRNSVNKGQDRGAQDKETHDKETPDT